MQAPSSLDVLLSELEPLLGPVTTPPQPLDGGFTNRNYRVGLGGEPYVVRVCGKNSGVLGIDRHHECEATRIAAGLGVAPDVVAFLPGEDCLVTRYVTGAPLGEGELRQEPFLSQIARMLRTVHDGPPFPGTFDAFTVVVEHRDVIVARGGREPEQYADAARAAALIAGALSGPDHVAVPCHNDLLAGNVLRDGDRLALVDWEYAGMNDRFFDLANLAVNNGLTPDDEARLLSVYFDEPPTGRHLAELSLMRIMSDFREAMWGALQAVVSDIEMDYDAYADQHFTRLRAAVDDPAFEENLHAAAA
jgi:thiamine kinase-like enzyme